MTSYTVVDTKLCNYKIWNIFANTQSAELKFCRVDVLPEPHIVIVTMISP